MSRSCPAPQIFRKEDLTYPASILHSPAFKRSSRSSAQAFKRSSVRLRGKCTPTKPHPEKIIELGKPTRCTAFFLIDLYTSHYLNLPIEICNARIHGPTSSFQTRPERMVSKLSTSAPFLHQLCRACNFLSAKTRTTLQLWSHVDGSFQSV